MNPWARVQAERDRRYEQRFQAQERAVELAVEEIERRLEGLNNEYRRADDVAKLTVRRDVYDRDLHETNDRFGRLEAFQSKLLGGLVLAAVLVPLVTGIVVFLLTRHAIPSTKGTP
jgi:hypothetical protein